MLTCKLLQPQDEACHQVAKLTHSQLTITWQVIVAVDCCLPVVIHLCPVHGYLYKAMAHLLLKSHLCVL